MSTELEYFNEITDTFVRAVYDTLGTDAGKATIEALKPVLGNAWKDGIILRKLANNNPVGRRVRFKLKEGYQIRPGDLYSPPGHGVPKKINAIKALRTLSGLGLLEAKNMIEESYEAWRFQELSKCIDDSDPLRVATHHRMIQSAMNDLAEAGWVVTYA